MNIRYSKKDPMGNDWEYPFVGSIHKITGLPHRKLMEMSNKVADGKMLRLWLGDRYSIVVSDPTLIREIWSKNFMSFTNRFHSDNARVFSGNYNNLITSDYDKWRPMKLLISSSLTKSKLRTLNSVMEVQSRNLVKLMKTYTDSDRVFYPAKYCKKFSMNIVLGIAFSKEISFDDNVNDEIVKKLIEPFEQFLLTHGQGNVLNFLSIFKPIVWYKRRKILKDLEKCNDYINIIYKEHLLNFNSENPRDLFDIIISECKDSVDRIIRVAFDLLLAASDTSASTIEWFMLYMINNPDIQEKMVGELRELKTDEVNLSHKQNTPYSNAVIKELMRLKPAAPLALNRCSNENIEIQGYYIPNNTQMLMNIYAIHHNEKYWPNPEKFDPDRFLLPENLNNQETWIPFGVGPRMCLGYNLALEEIYIAVCNILLNFKLTSETGSKIDETEIYGITIHPKTYGIKLEKRDISLF